MQEQPNPFGTPSEPQAPYSAPIPAPTGQMPAAFANSGVNDSGTGSTAVLPDELKGFNWGAFLLNWIWAIGHSTWIGLLCLVPYVGIIMQFVLGFKGNEMAWQNRKWDSVEHFRATQKVWAKWGIGLVILGLVIGVLAVIASIAFGGATRPMPTQ